MSFCPRFSEQEYRLFCDFVHDTYGITLARTKAELIALKLSPRLAAVGAPSFANYLNHLKYGDSAEQERARMISLVSNNETYFFREEDQLKAFAQVLSRLRDEKLAQGDRRLRVVSAGCSTGEEVYSLAMIAFEDGGFFFDWDFKVTGMDVDQEALARAEAGLYYPRSFRMADPARVDRFFTANGSGMMIKPGVRKFTSFVPGNLLSAADWSRVSPADIILCRNVLIYFSAEKINRALENFHRALLPGGRLLLGHSETIRTDLFSVEHHNRAIIYRRRD